MAQQLQRKTLMLDDDMAWRLRSLARGDTQRVCAADLVHKDGVGAESVGVLGPLVQHLPEQRLALHDPWPPLPAAPRPLLGLGR
eukprot:3876490-Rhodomonas_salina.2